MPYTRWLPRLTIAAAIRTESPRIRRPVTRAWTARVRAQSTMPKAAPAAGDGRRTGEPPGPTQRRARREHHARNGDPDLRPQVPRQADQGGGLPRFDSVPSQGFPQRPPPPDESVAWRLRHGPRAPQLSRLSRIARWTLYSGWGRVSGSWLSGPITAHLFPRPLPRTVKKPSDVSRFTW